LLRRRDIRSVPIVENGKLIGIITDRDMRQVAPAYPVFRDKDEFAAIPRTSPSRR
jgi:CBS domain-containing protein